MLTVIIYSRLAFHCLYNSAGYLQKLQKPASILLNHYSIDNDIVKLKNAKCHQNELS